MPATCPTASSLDTAQPRSGTRSLRIDNIGPEPYGAIAQSIEAAPYRGKIARFSAWLRTEDANDNGAVLTLLVLQGGATLEQNFMLDRPVKGTTPLDALHDHAPRGQGRRAPRGGRDACGARARCGSTTPSSSSSTREGAACRRCSCGSVT